MTYQNQLLRFIENNEVHLFQVKHSKSQACKSPYKFYNCSNWDDTRKSLWSGRLMIMGSDYIKNTNFLTMGLSSSVTNCIPVCREASKNKHNRPLNEKIHRTNYITLFPTQPDINMWKSSNFFFWDALTLGTQKPELTRTK